MTYATKILSFLSELEIHHRLPKGVSVLNPYKDKLIFSYCKKFYHKYYDDSRPRNLIVGINPGRFGGGLTGIPFTDPVKLEQECGIANELPKKTELSADFIYQLINAYGGKEKFYQKFYFSSVCPLGFTSQGKNFNYYDTPALSKALYPFILETLRAQIQFGVDTSVVFCLGEGKNFKFLSTLNEKEKLFDTIVPLPHPRFIMQYKRKKVDDYLNSFLNTLK
ncbi:MAG TPA: DUF4918 family protein [Cyclobacteriaceae bacterium]|nr:DUF4918 family protein [Cyclobacteriaceae bacterium]